MLKNAAAIVARRNSVRGKKKVLATMSRVASLNLPEESTTKSQLMSAPEIDRTLLRLAHEIVEKSGGTKNLALIGIVRRGVPLAQRITQAMRGIDGVDVPVGVLDITLYRDDLSKVAPQAVLRSSNIPFGVDNMDLVLVDDVLYTVRTVRAAMNGLFDLGRPKRVSLCRSRRVGFDF